MMKTIRILTIGNSYANNAMTYLDDLAGCSGDVCFDIGRANLGGCSLEKHWNLSRYTERHPDHKTYQIGTRDDGSPREASLQEALTAVSWDYVTLQQASTKSWRRDTFQPYLNSLHDLVRRSAPHAAILLHQTWAYRSDSSFFASNGLTQDLMFKRIRDTYAICAAELGCGVLPSGDAVQRARCAPGRTFTWPDTQFDYQHAESPALPRQDHSLARGWYWEINSSPEGIPELHLDAGHLNACGCYLAGCVWYERLTGCDVRQVPFYPADMSEHTAVFLRSIAHEVCGSYATINTSVIDTINGKV